MSSTPNHDGEQYPHRGGHCGSMPHVLDQSCTQFPTSAGEEFERRGNNKHTDRDRETQRDTDRHTDREQETESERENNKQQRRRQRALHHEMIVLLAKPGIAGL